MIVSDVAVIKPDLATRSFMSSTVAFQASVTLVPLIASAIEGRFDASPTASGAVLTAHLLASFIGGAVVSIRLPTARRVILLTASALLGAMFSIASITAWSIASTAAFLVASGAAFGVGSAIASSVLPSLANPMRAGFGAASWSLATGAVITALIPAVDTRNRGLIFVAIGALNLLLIPLMRGLPAVKEPLGEQVSIVEPEQINGQSIAEASNESVSRRFPLWMPLGTALLFGGDTALYAFALDFAKAAGLSDKSGGLVLGIGLVVGLVVTVIMAKWVPKNHVRLLVASSLAIALLKGALGYSNQSASFIAVLLAWNGLYLVAFTAFAVTAAKLDSSGRLAATSAAASFAGSALGPVLMGVAIDQYGLGVAGVAAGATSVLGMGAALLAVARVKRSV